MYLITLSLSLLSQGRNNVEYTEQLRKEICGRLGHEPEIEQIERISQLEDQNVFSKELYVENEEVYEELMRNVGIKNGLLICRYCVSWRKTLLTTGNIDTNATVYMWLVK
jgi:hypothetical protein